MADSTISKLTTAEGLIVETLYAGALAGQEQWVFDNAHWIQPHLDMLAYRGLITWEFDEDANFLVRVTPAFRSCPAVQSVGARQKVSA